jgi:hypothetical protein
MLLSSAQKFLLMPKWGTTFSHRFAESLGLDVEKAFHEVLDLHFDVIRLCVYWDEVQPDREKYLFENILSLLKTCEQRDQQVVLALGMKTPRWPEFYIPTWLPQDPADPQVTEALEKFLKKTVKTLSAFHCISTWQIENEPLDPSGPNNWTIPLASLKQEIKIVQEIDTRPILVTAWGNDLRRRNLLPELGRCGDIVGIDLYGHQHVFSTPFGSRYGGPRDSYPQITSLLETYCGERRWITELQAEPWEKDDAHFRSDKPKSMNVEILRDHIENALKIPVETVLFWGVEYWLWRAKNGDQSFLDFMQSFLPDAKELHL